MGLRQQIEQLLQAAPRDQQAVGLHDQWWTWAQLSDVATSVEGLCDDAGLGPGARIGVILNNRPECVALALGVLAAGRCITTLNPMQPTERFAADIVKTAPAMVIGTTEALAQADLEAAAASVATVARVSPDGEFTIGQRVERGDDAYAPGTAIEMLTSGTTGPPKRIRLSYQQLDSAFSAIAKAGPVKFSTSATIVSAPLVHIGGLWHALNTLLAGRRLVLMERFRVDDWVREVEQHRPKVVSLVPAALQSVVDAGVSPQSLSSIKAVTSGTAPCSPDLIDLVDRTYGIAVLTTYGATEFAGGIAGWSLADFREWMPAKRGSVGRPFKGVRIRAVDPETAEPLAVGEVGRLEVQSAQLGDDAAWVATSDLGRVDSDGFLFITGRADDAILRGGFKVQPSTIQKALEEHPAVKAVGVAGIPDERLGQVPVVAIELNPGVVAPTADEFKAWAKERLVAYEVPTQFKVVDQLPRTVSLKISRVDVAALFTS